MKNERAIQILSAIPFKCLEGTHGEFIANWEEVSEAIHYTIEKLRKERVKNEMVNE